MPTRRIFLVATTLGLSGFAVGLCAESRKGTKCLGIVHPEPPIEPDERRGWSAFDEEMRELGWTEGRDIAFERRYFHNDRARLSEILAELIALEIDVLFVQGAFAVNAAKQATDRIPIVFAVGDAVARGVVGNLARPERNATGVSNRVVEVNAKCVELLTQVSPGVSRVAILLNTNPGYPPPVFADPAPRRVERFFVDLKSAERIGTAMATVVERRADAIIVLLGPKDDPFKAALVEAIAKLRLPAVLPNRQYVELGGLLSLNRDLAYNFRRIAAYIDRILRGAKPSELPVEQPTAYELAINVKTAKRLGITIPRELLVRANWIVE